MSRRQLTHKQHAFLEFLREHIETRKIWPTYREIVEHFDYRSPNSVTQNLQALSRKGFLLRDRNGYQLVDKSGRDGSIDLVGTLRPGHIEGAEASARFSLADLNDALGSLRAIRVGPDVHATAQDLDGATFVFVAQDDTIGEGDLALVLDGADLGLLEAGANGPPEGDGVHVLGRYAGHAGPYGVVLPAGAAPVQVANVAPKATTSAHHQRATVSA